MHVRTVSRQLFGILGARIAIALLFFFFVFCLNGFQIKDAQRECICACAYASRVNVSQTYVWLDKRRSFFRVSAEQFYMKLPIIYSIEEEEITLSVN